MPRFAESFQHMVFFLFGTNPKDGALSGPLGSGVFVGVRRKGDVPPDMEKIVVSSGRAHIYAVTAHHVLRSGGNIIRVNTRGGGSRLIETEPSEWHFDPNGGDVAVLDVTDLVGHPDDETSWVPEVIFADKAFLERVNFNIGEDGFMLGLLADQPGKTKNLVASRSGNVTMLASDDDPIEQPGKRIRPSHLFDIRSRPGFSGSPVFVYRAPSGNLRFLTARGVDTFARFRITKDIKRDDDEDPDIDAGQYHDTVKARKAATEEAVPLLEGDELRTPNSIAIVVPIEDIKKLFQHPRLMSQRKAREEREPWGLPGASPGQKKGKRSHEAG
jgi:hypothetical protein